LSNGTLLSNKSGSVKEHTQTSSEMRTSCQRDAYWLATNHLSAQLKVTLKLD